MTNLLSPLMAESVTKTTFEWAKIESNSDWILPIVVLLGILLFVRYMYRRDAEELRPWWKWLLTALRTAVFIGLLVLYLQPHWRSEREEVRNSRALLLFDTSLSMGLSDADSPAAAEPARNRAQEAADALEKSDFIRRLRQTHDVAAFMFDDALNQEAAVNLKKIAPRAATDGERAPQGTDLEENIQSPTAPDWHKLLAPAGAETRLGQSLLQLIQQERGTPVSGVILFSDGGQNAGVSPEAAVELAREAKIPVFTVGIGSDKRPTNVAVSDLIVPPRAYPGDQYAVTGFLQAHGMAGKTVVVRVVSRPADDGTAPGEDGKGELVESREVTLGGDGEVLPVEFELQPGPVGRRTLRLQVEAPAGDRNPADNAREADIEIVDRKTRVLLLADGATREYQFLRNLLFRDEHTTVDVLLQRAPEGISQDADRILDDFPALARELFEYDCIVAFDPDWKKLGGEQIKLLEQWVADQGGGLIVVAGAVHACGAYDSWVHEDDMAIVRNLYPVEFYGKLATVDGGIHAGKEAWPLDFTREGQEAEFLWLADSATANRHAWEEFPGVYSCALTRGPKPASAVYARFSDPRAVQGGNQPIYLAGQFYGSGRVFYLGSGEMWRLRAVDENYFDAFYTKLIRHVSQGRLLRGSSRGSLLVGQDRYLLGNTVEVRAKLYDLRMEPLEAPSVKIEVYAPDESTRGVILEPDPTMPGAFLGQFPALMEGTYRIELPVPESDERLSLRIQVKAPDLERENPCRNDALLSEIAEKTGGRYYIGMEEALAKQGVPPLVMQLKDRTSTVVLPITPDPREKEDWLRWIMIALCGLLCLEWTVRRLLRLA
ncbi:MAG: VWA domain-containing protein [Pirellulales bacterium]|nr:VWA domain-containing protein [Pirellulales bacterium]